MTVWTLVFSMIVLAACAAPQEQGMGPGMMGEAPSISEEAFLSEMIPHHQEAVDTSRIIYENTEDEALRNLTRRIIDAQEEEIALMQGWLDEWYDGGVESSYEPMMPRLEEYEGRAQDEAYLQGMIMHHMMALHMAQGVLAAEPREEVASFAQGVLEVQSAEMREMRRMLG